MPYLLKVKTEAVVDSTHFERDYHFLHFGLQLLEEICGSDCTLISGPRVVSTVECNRRLCINAAVTIFLYIFVIHISYNSLVEML